MQTRVMIVVITLEEVVVLVVVVVIELVGIIVLGNCVVSVTDTLSVPAWGLWLVQSLVAERVVGGGGDDEQLFPEVK